MSIGNVRLSRPYRPPFYDQDQDSDPTPVQVITIKANVAARIATAMGCKVGLLFPTLSRDAESMVAV